MDDYSMYKIRLPFWKDINYSIVLVSYWYSYQLCYINDFLTHPLAVYNIIGLLSILVGSDRWAHTVAEHLLNTVFDLHRSTVTPSTHSDNNNNNSNTSPSSSSSSSSSSTPLQHLFGGEILKLAFAFDLNPQILLNLLLDETTVIGNYLSLCLSPDGVLTLFL